MTKLTFRAWTVPLALLLLCLLSFGLLVPGLGFYWDDWPTVWFLHLLGPAGFKEVFAVDRPSLAWLFMLTTRLVGESTLSWQLFSILMRWVSCLALWWTLRVVWPQYPRQVTWVAFLFAVYPGFKQQPIAVTYSHDWIILAGFIFSLGLMISAIRHPKWFWPLMALSWLISAYAMFSDEYYFGLELLRPVLLWMALEDKVVSWRKRLGRVLLYWAPYVAIMITFLIWRIFLHVSPRGQVQVFGSLLNNPLKAIVQLFGTILQDFFETGFFAWLQAFDPRQLFTYGKIFALVYSGVVVITAVLTIIYLSRLQITPVKETDASLVSSHRWAVQAILLGIYSLLLGGWPFWVTELPIKLKFPWDRFTLAMMLGSCLLLVGIIDFPRMLRSAKVVLLAILIALAVGLNFQNAMIYRIDWNMQKALFWQLAWRAPGLKPGTTLLTSDLPLKYFTDNSLTAPLNWLYAPKETNRQMPYLMYDIEVRLGSGLPSLQKDQPIHQPYRATNFDGSTSQAVVFYYAPNSCLKVLDPLLDASWPQKPKFVAQALPLSDTGNILTDMQLEAKPPANIYGPEPPHDWCYFFEKADLARQMGDWPAVAQLGTEASQMSLKPINPAEWSPFIEAYARTGQWQFAKDLSIKAYQDAPRVQAVICATWARLGTNTTSDPLGQATLRQVRGSLECPAS